MIFQYLERVAGCADSSVAWRLDPSKESGGFAALWEEMWSSMQPNCQDQDGYKNGLRSNRLSSGQ
eukprot:m.105967 g.105967  ORF g.105967 m.105967 type:complete len:65 (-) comp22517_c1_seq1:676-870(-)